ncbi:MAG: NfeD family protein, partial [Actinomycetota bacterium]|nr:NfeD family protein [Actinomycetota bacterium]
AQDAAAGPVVVADIRGPLDQRGLDFLTDAVGTEDAQLIVLKIDNRGIASGNPDELFTAIARSSIPVVAWAGPDGARAYGGAGQLLVVAAAAGAAPGARVGYFSPTVAGEALVVVGGPDLLHEEMVIEDQGINELITIVEPTIGQFIAALDGVSVVTADGNVVLETATTVTLEDGTVATVSSVDVRFLKPTLLSRFLRLGVRPDAAFFFLLIGLAAAAFEFYAAGAGVAAAVAVLSLFLAGYGFATLPMNWLAVVAVIAGLGLYTWDFQRHELGLRSVVGTGLMLWGGLTFTSGAPQFGTSLWGVVLTVLGIMLFYLFAMTTIVRSRFGTPTIGREHLVGMAGVAETQLAPDGVVLIDGAKWRARAHRAAGVERGSAIEVLAVEGITLQVAPVEDNK